uniref:Protein no-on-transient A n=1 Tax=Glossina palpalis gambiensis TaxID=67801 RepID=A0A1B0C1A5_9MUSC
MEGGAKNDVNGGAPLPQRPPKNVQGNKNFNKNPSQSTDSPMEKKPRFMPGVGPNNQSGGGNQNKGFGGNKGFGNRNRNRGSGGNNQNRGGNFQNQVCAFRFSRELYITISAGCLSANIISFSSHWQQEQDDSMQDQSHQPPSNADCGNDDVVMMPPPQMQNLNQSRQNQGGGGGGGNRGPGGGNQRRDRSRSSGGGNRASMGGPGGPGGPGRNDDFFIGQRLRAISGPTHELPAIENTEETKFSGRNRLYVGNLTNDVTEEELREIFKPFGEIGEVFSNPDKNFAFLKLDYHANAERAKRELDGTMRKGRMLRVRYAPNATIVRVSNLTPFVSNELLYKSFEVFGPVEKANVNVDDRGKTTGEGIVEFAKKSSANMCLRFCNEKCYFLTASLRPCVVEPFEANDDTDGLPEKSLNKKAPEFNQERSVGPRFADLGSFEHEYGTRWKQLHELFKSKQEALKRELKMEEEKLEAQMEYARYEHETELLRQELRKRESDNERKKMEWEMREKQAEEMRKREEEQMRRTQNEMQSRMMRQEEEMRRRQQENTLFMQAQQLNSILDQQEGGFSGNCSNFDNFGGAGAGGNNNSSPFDFRGNNNSGGGGNGPNGPNGPSNQQVRSFFNMFKGRRN